MVGVVNPDSSTSNKVQFVVASPTVQSPTLTSINPNSVVAGSAGFTLVAKGTNFVSGSQVMWNGNAVTSTFVSATEVDASIPASLVATFGTANVGCDESWWIGIEYAATFHHVPGTTACDPGVYQPEQCRCRECRLYVGGYRN